VHAEPQPVGAWPHEPERPPPPTPDPDATTTAVLLDA